MEKLKSQFPNIETSSVLSESEMNDALGGGTNIKGCGESCKPGCQPGGKDCPAPAPAPTEQTLQ